MAKRKAKEQKPWYKKWWAIVLFVIVGFYLIGLISQPNNNTNSSENNIPVSNSYCGNNVCESGESYASCPQDCKLKEVQSIAEVYHKTHTYSLNDFYVCSDMAMDVWNLIKTQGINAEICAGNVDENISSYLNGENWDDVLNYYNNMNHAWVIAEVEPFTYIAVETTGGYLVWGNSAETTPDEVKNQLYYTGTCFNTPKQFKSFIDARKEMLTTCSKTIDMENYWNENYVGKLLTSQASEYKGKIEQKEQDCLAVVNEIKGLQSS